MPTARNDGVELYYGARGSGPTVVFVNPAGYGAWCWSWLAEALAGPFETLVWDLRGTGRSDAPDGPYDVETLAADLEAVLSAHGSRTVHLVGAGLGGMIALQYARENSRAATLTLLGTTADGSRVDQQALAGLVTPSDDPDALRESLRGAFSSGVLPAHPDTVDRIVEWRQDDDADPAGWDAQITAMVNFDASDSLYEVTTPALVCHGREDGIVPLDAGRDLAAGLPRGTLQAVEAGHLLAAEEPAVVEDALTGLLEQHIGSL